MTAVTITQGLSGGFVWPVLNPDNTPADLTGYTARAQVRAYRDVAAPLYAELTATVAAGEVRLTWTDEQTREWLWNRGHVDVVLRDALGAGRERVLSGVAVLDRTVTVHG